MLSKRLILWIAAICLSISVLMLYSEYRTKNLLQDFLLNKDLLEIVNKSFAIINRENPRLDVCV